MGLGFIGVSLLVGWMLVVKPIHEHLRVGQWEQLPATITSVKMLENVNPSNGGTTSYECQASYRYEVAGKTYEASGVSIYKGSDNLSNFQQRIFNELSNHEKSGKPFRAYVNPDNPEQAVLYRSIRWGVTIGVAILVLLFCSAGFVIILKP